MILKWKKNYFSKFIICHIALVKTQNTTIHTITNNHITTAAVPSLTFLKMAVKSWHYLSNINKKQNHSYIPLLCGKLFRKHFNSQFSYTSRNKNYFCKFIVKEKHCLNCFLYYSPIVTWLKSIFSIAWQI